MIPEVEPLLMLRAVIGVVLDLVMLSFTLIILTRLTGEPEIPVSRERFARSLRLFSLLMVVCGVFLLASALPSVNTAAGHATLVAEAGIGSGIAGMTYVLYTFARDLRP